VVSSHETKALGKKVIVPDHTVVAISFQDEDEAHYVCALLNSNPAQLVVVGYVVLHPSPHILRNIRIPRYQQSEEIHKELAGLSRQCHEKVTAGIDTDDVQGQIDYVAANL
ncbi:MAG: hypothetical protein HQ578_00435, partial [Chloroflexi bacterium]|nr:hypothetical protein [Chloroflexota bacterium]